MKTRRKNIVRGHKRENYLVTLMTPSHLLRSVGVSDLRIAGKMFVNPRMMISEDRFYLATEIKLTKLAPWREWTRDPQDPAWFVAVGGTDIVHELPAKLAGGSIETTAKQLLEWFPELNGWRAVALATQFANNALIRLGRFEILELSEVDPRQAEIEALALEQEAENEGS